MRKCVFFKEKVKCVDSTNKNYMNLCMIKPVTVLADFKSLTYASYKLY